MRVGTTELTAFWNLLMPSAVFNCVGHSGAALIYRLQGEFLGTEDAGFRSLPLCLKWEQASTHPHHPCPSSEFLSPWPWGRDVPSGRREAPPIACNESNKCVCSERHQGDCCGLLETEIRTPWNASALSNPQNTALGVGCLRVYQLLPWDADFWKHFYLFGSYICHKSKLPVENYVGIGILLLMHMWRGRGRGISCSFEKHSVIKQ